MRRRSFLKSVSGLFLPAAFPAIVSGQVFGTYIDQPFLAKNATAVSSGLNTNLVAYWRLEESGVSTRADSTGNGNTLTYQEGATSASTGICANGANSAGGTRELDASGSGTFFANVQSGDSFSMSAWLNFNSVPSTGFHGVISLWDSAVISYFVWFANNNTLIYSSSNAAGTITTDITVANPPSSGAWNHLAFGYDDGLQQKWAQWNNGTRLTQTSVGVFKSALTVHFQLLAYNGGTSPVDMIMDEVGWWRRSLSTADVSLLYNGGAALCWPFT